MSKKKCVREDYLFLCASIRAKEAKMLNLKRAERILDAQDFEEAAKLLTDFGYEDVSGMTAGEIDSVLNDHRAGIFKTMTNEVPNKELVDIFRIKYDYHNAKTIIKSEAGALNRTDLLSRAGRVAPELLLSEYNSENFLHETKTFAGAIAEAKSVLSRTANPQLADFVLDRAYFSELNGIAKKLESSFVSGYIKAMIDSANLRSLVRTIRMKKDEDFLRTALVEGGNVGTARILAAVDTPGNIESIFAPTVMKTAAALGVAATEGGRMTEFEKECDNAVTEYLRKAKLISFGEGPVVAYLAAVENEITAVRMMLTGFLAGISPDVIRERLRDFYA